MWARVSKSFLPKSTTNKIHSRAIVVSSFEFAGLFLCLRMFSRRQGQLTSNSFAAQIESATLSGCLPEKETEGYHCRSSLLFFFCALVSASVFFSSFNF